MFNSYIYKEENVYDRNINEYAAGVDALLESERAKNSLLEFEESLWDTREYKKYFTNPASICWQGLLF